MVVPRLASVVRHREEGSNYPTQRGALAVASAAGHLGVPLTPTLSKKKKEEGNQMGPQLAGDRLEDQ